VITNKTSFLIVVMFSVAFSFCINANPVHAENPVVWKGVTSCEDWTKRRKEGNAGYYETATLGILSGMQQRPYPQKMVNFWTAKGSELTVEKVFQFIDKICLKNPKNLTYIAITHLWFHQTGEAMWVHQVKK